MAYHSAMMSTQAYLLGLRCGFRDAFSKLAGYGESALLGAAVGGLLGNRLGGQYGYWLAGNSPAYRDVKSQELAWRIAGTLGGANLGAGVSMLITKLLKGMPRGL